MRSRLCKLLRSLGRARRFLSVGCVYLHILQLLLGNRHGAGPELGVGVDPSRLLRIVLLRSFYGPRHRRDLEGVARVLPDLARSIIGRLLSQAGLQVSDEAEQA